MPVVHPASYVPHAVISKLKEELDKMEETGVIKKVTIPMDWVNSLVAVEKPNSKSQGSECSNQATTLPHANPGRRIVQIGRRMFLQQTRCQIRLLATETGRAVIVPHHF